MRKAAVAVIAMALLAGLAVLWSRFGNLPRVEPEPAFQEERTLSYRFDEPAGFKVGESAAFPDGLLLALLRVDDSRCPEGVVCVWQGELSPVFRAEGGAYETAEEIRLGELTAPGHAAGPYRYVLLEASPDSATVTIEPR